MDAKERKAELLVLVDIAQEIAGDAHERIGGRDANIWLTRKINELAARAQALADAEPQDVAPAWKWDENESAHAFDGKKHLWIDPFALRLEKGGHACVLGVRTEPNPSIIIHLFNYVPGKGKWDFNERAEKEANEAYALLRGRAPK